MCDLRLRIQNQRYQPTLNVQKKKEISTIDNNNELKTRGGFTANTKRKQHSVHNMSYYMRESMKFTRCRRMNHIGMCSSYSSSNIDELIFSVFFFFCFSFFIINGTRHGSSSDSMTKFEISNCEMELFFLYRIWHMAANDLCSEWNWNRRWFNYFNIFVQRKCYYYDDSTRKCTKYFFRTNNNWTDLLKTFRNSNIFAWTWDFFIYHKNLRMISMLLRNTWITQIHDVYFYFCFAFILNEVSLFVSIYV